MVGSEVEQPAAGLHPPSLVGAFGDLADQVGLTRDRLHSPMQFCFERFCSRDRGDYPGRMTRSFPWPGRPLVEAEHERRLPLPLAIHRTRQGVLSRAIPLDRFHVIGQLDLLIRTSRNGRNHTLTVRRGSEGY